MRLVVLAWLHVFCHLLCTFLCRHYFTPSDHIGCLNTARFQVLTTLICPGSVTSYHATMVSRSLRLHLGLMISCSSPWTHAAPARGANLCVASVLFCSVTMRTVCLPSILGILSFLGCIFVYGKSGFSPLVMTSTSLPSMSLVWTTPSLITSVTGIYLQFITHALPP